MADEQAKEFINQATQSLQNGQFDQALELIDQAIALDPNNSEAYVLKGIALSQTNQPDAATDALRQAITLSPYNAKAYYNLAVHLYSIGKKNEAMDMAREAVNIDPKHSGARELVTRIENERHPQPAEPRPSAYPGDPLSAPPPPAPGDPIPGQGPGQQAPSDPLPPGTGFRPPETPGQPMGAPPAPGQPYGQPPVGSPYGQQQYTRPGYEAPAHNLPFIEKMGSAWRVIGWALVASSLAVFIISIFMMGDFFAAMANPENMEAAMQQIMEGGGAGNIFLNILSMVAWIGSLLYMIFDIIDRRGNWLWLLAFFVGCCCCGLYWVPMAIYLFAERN
jgi:tetratricopeptide (TPR) repeat protein